jgi:hypothetical protein
MAFQMTYPNSLTLKQLNGRMRNDEGAAGSVTGIGHSDDETLANFDEGSPPEGELLLDEMESDTDKERDGHTFICTGSVWVQGELKDVGAFRAD